MTGQCYLLFFTQMILLFYMASEIKNDEDMQEELVKPAENISTVIGRFVCALVMHITLTGEI